MAGLTANQRKELITDLATNCDCWKGEEEILNQFSDDKLVALKQRENAVVVANAAVNGFSHNGTDYRVNPETGNWEKKVTSNAGPKMPMKGRMPPQAPAEEEEEEETVEEPVYEDVEEEPVAPPPRRRPVPATNRHMSVEESLKNLHPDIRAMVENAKQVEEREKDSLIRQILVNVSPTDWQTHYERLMQRTVPELTYDLSLIPRIPKEEPAPTRNTRVIPRNDPDEASEVLPPPTYNWSNVKQESGHSEMEGEPVRNESNGSNLSEEEWLKMAPPGARTRVLNAMKLESGEKRRLIDQIMTNAAVSDEQAERRLMNRLETKSLEELRDFSLLVPVRTERRNNFFGASTPIGNASKPMINNNEQDDLLLPPTAASLKLA